MVDKWLHINGSVGDPWVKPIKSAIGNVVKEGRMKKALIFSPHADDECLMTGGNNG